MTDSRSDEAGRHWPRRIGVIGLGRMGSAFAHNLLADGHRLVVCDRTPDKAETLHQSGADIALSLTDLSACDLVLTSVADDHALAAVTLGDGGLLETLPFGAIHLSMSTVSPTISDQLAAMHAARGQSFLAAPVLGNPDLAAARKLYVILGGDASARALALPLLERLAARVFPVGDVAGHASLLKLAGNVLTASTLQAMAEVMALVRKADIDPRTAFDLFTGSLFDGKVHKAYGGKILDQRYTPPGMTVPLAVKDLDLALSQAGDLCVPMPAAHLVHDRLVAVVEAGWAQLDWSALGLLAARDAAIDDPIPANASNTEGA